MSRTTDQLPQLIKMINQIVTNQPVEVLGEEAATAAVADHIKKFWAPPMLEKITAYEAEGGEELSDVARQAIILLSGKVM